MGAFSHLEIHPISSWIVDSPEVTLLQNPITLEPIYSLPNYVLEDYQEELTFLQKHAGQLAFGIEIGPHKGPEDLGRGDTFERLVKNHTEIYIADVPIVAPEAAVSPYQQRIAGALAAAETTLAFCHITSHAEPSRTSMLCDDLLYEAFKYDWEQDKANRSCAHEMSDYDGRMALALEIIALTLQRWVTVAEIGAGLQHLYDENPALADEPYMNCYVRLNPRQILVPPALRQLGIPKKQMRARVHQHTRTPEVFKGTTGHEIVVNSRITSEQWQRVR